MPGFPEMTANPSRVSLPLRHDLRQVRPSAPHHSQHQVPQTQNVQTEQPRSERSIPRGDVESGDEGPRARRLRIQNRRRRYLELHPEYFSASNLELADSLLYDRLIRRWQSPSQRERDGRARGIAGGLEASLMRGEAKVAEIQRPDASNPLVWERAAAGEVFGLEEDADERVTSLEEGEERWKVVMGGRFLRGEDGEFEYGAVDGAEEFDDWEEEGRGEQESWFGEQEEEFVGGEGGPRGETGVQDF